MEEKKKKRKTKMWGIHIIWHALKIPLQVYCPSFIFCSNIEEVKKKKEENGFLYPFIVGWRGMRVKGDSRAN